jgi:hypothetical protein
MNQDLFAELCRERRRALKADYARGDALGVALRLTAGRALRRLGEALFRLGVALDERGVPAESAVEARP